MQVLLYGCTEYLQGNLCRRILFYIRKLKYLESVAGHNIHVIGISPRDMGSGDHRTQAFFSLLGAKLKKKQTQPA